MEYVTSGFLLSLLPQLLQAFQTKFGQGLPLLAGKAFHLAETLLELRVCAAECHVGIEPAMARHVHEAEHDIAKLVFQAVGIRIFGVTFSISARNSANSS